MFFSNLKTPQLSRHIERIALSPLPVVAIIMSVFNHWEYTRDALQSYFSNLDDEYHYILVLIDDFSRDQTQDFLIRETQSHDDIVYLRFKDNGGLTRLWNYGIRYAIESLHADYIMLANNDILIPSGALGKLVNGLKDSSGMSVIGPLTNCSGMHQKTQDIRHFLPDYASSNIPQDIEKTSRRIAANPLQMVDEINGFFWGGHRNVFIKNIFWSWGQSIYYFNPLNRNLHNEREFQHRLIKKGGKAILASNTFIFHYKDISMNRVQAGRIDPQWVWRPAIKTIV